MGGVGSPAMMGLGAFGTSLGMTPLGAGADGLGIGEGAAAGSSGINARDQDDDMRRLEEIVKMLAGRWGRVCQEGVERCARRVGLEWMWEEGAKRTLSIAGAGVLVDVEFTGEDVGAVVLNFPASGQEVAKLAGRGADVLMKDLKGNGQGYVMLDAFVGNLERLAKMDRLGGPGVSCFDAVQGVYGCMERIFEWELGKLTEERGFYGDNESLAKEVMCKGSGRPRMHANGRVGFTLLYWQERRLVPGRKQKAYEMKIDSSNEAELDDRGLKIYSALIECEASPSELYPPIRISDAWVTAQVESVPSLETNPLYMTSDSPIDWQEPPPTFLSPEPLPGAMSLDPGLSLPRKPPSLRFVAHLEPPIIIPLDIAVEIYNSVGAPLAEEFMPPTTYEALLFADIDQSSKKPPAGTPFRKSTGTVISYPPTGPSLKHRHQYTLFATHPQPYGRTIDRIPFSHPRQLVALLPLLRQWALLGSMLRRTFASQSKEEKKNLHGFGVSGKTHGEDEGEVEEEEEAALSNALANASTLEEELAALLAPPPTTPSDHIPALPVDIPLSLTPSPPRLGNIFGLAQAGAAAAAMNGLVFAIGPNGVLTVLGLGAHGQADEATVAKTEKIEKARKVLEISESVGVLVAWICGGGRGGAKR